MSQRQQITIEDILRSETGLSDIAQTLRTVLEEIPSAQRHMLVLGALALAETGLQVAVALLARDILNGATADAGTINRLALSAAVAFTVISFVVVRVRLRRQEILALTSRERAVKRLAHNITHASYLDLTAVPMAALREILMTDVDTTYRFYIESQTQLVIIAFWLLAALAVTAVISPLLLLLMIGLGVLIVAVVGYGFRQHSKLTGERFVRLAELSQRARDVVEVERVLLARQFGLGNFFIERLMSAHGDYVETSAEQGRLTADVRSVVLMLNSFSFLAMIGMGGWLLANDNIRLGGLIAILFVIGQLLAAVANLSAYVIRAAETAVSGKRLRPYWNAATDTTLRHVSSDQSVKAVTLRDVGFRYQQRQPVLEDVSARLETGCVTVLTAETGAGKSTLALIVTGMLQPDAGSVTINDQPNWTPDELPAGKILYVGSKPILIEGSVKQNLFLPEPTPDQMHMLERVFRHVRRSSEAFPLDEQIIAANGTGVSSGQGQLIQLARAVVRDPDVVIFDEATSSLDMPTEAAVQRELLDWCRQRVCLVISHRACPWTEQADVHLTL